MTPEERREYQRAWRARQPGYNTIRNRIDRLRRKRHVCPGNGRPCMTEIPGAETFCTFCRRHPGTIYRSDELATRMIRDTWWPK